MTVLGRAGAAVIVAWGAALALFPIYKGLWLGFAPVLMGLGLGAALWRWRSPLSSWMDRWSNRQFAVAALSMALVARIAAALYFPLVQSNDHEMFYRLAASVAGGTGYGWGYGPSAFFPPGLPLLLALWFAVVGIGLWQAKIFGIVLGMVCVWATYRIADWAFGRMAGRWALVLAATSPTLVFYSVTVGYEPLLAVVLCGWAMLTERLESRTASWALIAALGAVMGIGTLIKPVCLLLPAVCLVRWLPSLRLVAVTRAAAAATILLLVVLPWTMRNWQVLGSPVLVSTNGGVVLYAANNPESQGLAMGVAPLSGEHDEVSRDRIRRDAAFAWMLGHPIEWCRLAIAKVVYVWGTSSSIMSYVSYDRMTTGAESVAKAVLNVGWSALFVFCWAGTFQAGAWDRPRFHSAGLGLVYFFVLHLFFEALSRHHIGVMPFLFAIAGAGLQVGVEPRRSEARA